MPLFHFTLRAYRSWNADHPRGYLKRGEKGVHEPDEALAEARDRLARFSAVRFDEEDARFLVEQSHDVVKRREAKLYGVTVIETHVHLVAGWEGERDEEDVQTRLKRGFGFLLAGRHGTKGRPYFSRGGVPEAVRDREHLRYLLYEYFPRHHGVMWRVELE
jgi:hypothetical protein